MAVPGGAARLSPHGTLHEPPGAAASLSFITLLLVKRKPIFIMVLRIRNLLQLMNVAMT